jgi:hypothetical protein
MKINLLPIVSSLHNEVRINQETQSLLNEIEDNSEIRFSISGLTDFYRADLSLILVQSGGSEGQFLKLFNQLKEPYYLLTYGSNNSLAASMEILSYLNDLNKQAEILHGQPQYIIKRLNQLMERKQKKIVNLGVVGKPSDWLIASNVNYDLCRKLHQINLVDIDIEELIDIYQKIDSTNYETNVELPFNHQEVEKAKRLSKAMEMIVNRYHLKGLTIRCFDLLDSIHTTGCIGLSFLNKNNKIGTCEGDIPAMISMYILNAVTNQSSFQANPSRIDFEKNEIVFAHCTLPLDMSKTYNVMTHYESGIGVALRGKLRLTDITVFKLSRNLKDYYVSEGVIIENLEENNLCRTQIKVRLNDVSYFLKNPYGNHHLIVYGKHKKNIDQYFIEK